PRHELALLGAEGVDRLAEVRHDEQQSRRPIALRRVEQHELVLPQHTLGEVAEHDADLCRDDDPDPELHRRSERSEALARALEDRVEHLLHRLYVARDPFAAADALRRWQWSRRL